MVAKIIGSNLIQILEKQRMLNQLDPLGEKLLALLQIEEVKQQELLKTAEESKTELSHISKKVEVAKAEEAVAAFKASKSAEVIRDAIYTPGYVTVETMPQVNKAVVEYAELIKKNPVLVTDEAQQDKLPFTRRELFTLGRRTREVDAKEVEKAPEVNKLEQVVEKYECSLRKRHGNNFNCEHATEQQLKEAKIDTGTDILNFIKDENSVRAKSPPEVQKQGAPAKVGPAAGL